MGEPQDLEKDPIGPAHDDGGAHDGAARNDTVAHAEQLVDDLEERVLGRRPDSRRETQEEGDAPAFEQDLDEKPAERGPGAEPS